MLYLDFNADICVVPGSPPGPEGPPVDRLVSWAPGTSSLGRGRQRGVVAVVRRVVEEGGAVANAVAIYQDSMQGGLKHGKEERCEM